MDFIKVKKVLFFEIHSYENENKVGKNTIEIMHLIKVTFLEHK